MSRADTVFIEDTCGTLKQLLLDEPLNLVKAQGTDPNAGIKSQQFCDFEVGYELSSEGTELLLKVTYQFLEDVMLNGSQGLLDELLDGLPLRCVSCQANEIVLGLDAASLAGSDSMREKCASRLAMMRIWLFIGPLVEKLRWCRSAIRSAEERAARVVPGSRRAAAGDPPPAILQIQVRWFETCWIVAKSDRVMVIFSVDIPDDFKVDVAFGRAFCQEFAETNRKNADYTPPCGFHEPKDVPSDLRGITLAQTPNVGFLTLTLTDAMIRGASDERLIALAKPVMTFRDFFQFHIKSAKGYLQSRLRKKLDHWQEVVEAARRRPKPDARRTQRTATGKEFAPHPRPSTSSRQPPP